jgi:hypothetical protein
VLVPLLLLLVALPELAAASNLPLLSAAAAAVQSCASVQYSADMHLTARWKLSD